MNDDEEPRRATPIALGSALDRLSVFELEAHKAALKAEIVRVEAEIARRKDVRSAAEALFRKPAG